LSFLDLRAWLVMAVVASPLTHAQTLKVLHAFTGSPDGAEPSAGLIRDTNGNFYGTTYLGGTGGSFPGAGTVYKIDSTGKETVLYSFCPSAPCTDGSNPSGALVLDSAGNLYGTTSSGGGSSEAGTVFEISAAGPETVLYNFKGLALGDGSTPGYGSLWLDSQGLYGTTAYGGRSCSYSSAGCGTIWRVDLSGHETVLHRFRGADGAIPVAGVIRDGAGSIYGTTLTGGANGLGCGVLFQYAPGPHHLTVLHDFCTGTDGSIPISGLIMKGNDLYGTTQSGGANGCGLVYKVTRGSGETILHSFGSGIDGCGPTYGSLVFDAGRTALYGTTTFGGGFGDGVVYKVSVDGSNEQVLYTFTGASDGGQPYGTLVRNGPHNLYGTTSSFGASGWGTVFKLFQP
jgi:uncharacterized repeat protein (TIGR03803 family)